MFAPHWFPGTRSGRRPSRIRAEIQTEADVRAGAAQPFRAIPAAIPLVHPQHQEPTTRREPRLERRDQSDPDPRRIS